MFLILAAILLWIGTRQHAAGNGVNESRINTGSPTRTTTAIACAARYVAKRLLILYHGEDTYYEIAVAVHCWRRPLCCSPPSPVVFGDEGMWLFNNPPREYLKKKYDFDATQEWLDHVQKSSVRFNSGGSGSFVSPDGLVMTNHHVGADACKRSATRSTITTATASTPGPGPTNTSATIWNSTS